MSSSIRRTTGPRATTTPALVHSDSFFLLCCPVPHATPPCSANAYVRAAPAEQPLPYHPQRQGVPVTRFTAAPGMLVRRGYDVASGEDGAAMESGEVGCALLL